MYIFSAKFTSKYMTVHLFTTRSCNLKHLYLELYTKLPLSVQLKLGKLNKKVSFVTKNLNIYTCKGTFSSRKWYCQVCLVNLIITYFKMHKFFKYIDIFLYKHTEQQKPSFLCELFEQPSQDLIMWPTQDMSLWTI